MERFDKKGMMIYPNPKTKDSPCVQENLVVVKSCYCQNGHSLISERVKFDIFSGILIQGSRMDQNGLVALSPVYGCNHRISIDLDFEDGEVWDFFCPECESALPYYTQCECGANMTTLFINEKADFQSSIVICNRVGCHHAKVVNGDEVLTDSMLEAY